MKLTNISGMQGTPERVNKTLLLLAPSIQGVRHGPGIP